MALQDLAGLGAQRLIRLAEVLLGRRRHVLHRRANFDDRNAVGQHRHALGGVDLRRGHVELVREQADVLALLHDGHDERAAASHDLDAPRGLVGEHVLAAQCGAGDDHRLVRRDGLVAGRQQNHQQDEDDDERDGDDEAGAEGFGHESGVRGSKSSGVQGSERCGSASRTTNLRTLNHFTSGVSGRCGAPARPHPLRKAERRGARRRRQPPRLR